MKLNLENLCIVTYVSSLCIKVFLFSVEECFFFRRDPLRNIARLRGTKYVFIEFRREDSHRQFFRRISVALHVFSERVSEENVRC